MTDPNARICGCPVNGAGDIQCHICGERVNRRCWNCKTPRGEGPCPNPLTGTDMPPRNWGAIDRSALTSKMPIVAYNPMHIDRIPGPAKSIASLVELADNEAMKDAFAPMQSVLAKLTRKLIADEEEAVMALRARAEETGDQRGVDVVHRSINDGDTIRFKMTATLSDEVPYGLINRRWEFEPLRPL